MSKYSPGLILALVICLPLVICASPGKDFSKSILKEFDISRDATIDLSNKYGSVDIRTWDAAKAKIEVTIKADARNQDAADEIFNRISVTFENSSSFVRAKTEIETVSGWKSWFNIGGDGDQFEINYVVYVPASVVLNLDNKYGNIYCADMNNRASVTLKYGNLKLGNFSGNVDLVMGYANGSMQSAKDINLDLSYSDLFLGKAGNVKFEGKYSDLNGEDFGNVDANTGYVDFKVNKVARLTNSGKYDDFIIEQVQSVDVNTKYTSVNIGSLKDFAEFEMGYGSVTIGQVMPGFQTISVNSSYTDVSIDVDDNAKFTFDAETKYCGINHYGIEVYYELDKSNEHQVKGFRGSKDASSKISATMNYGGLKIR